MYITFNGCATENIKKGCDEVSIYLNADEEYYNQLIVEELNKVNWREFEDEFATDED